MVTLTGVGGVGKTRLAVQVAAELLPRFRDGAWLCELGPVADPGPGARGVAAALGVQQRPGDESSRRASSTRCREPGAVWWCSTTASISSTPPPAGRRDRARVSGVRVLATSREGLGRARGTASWWCRSLELPATDGIPGDPVAG